MTLGRIDPAVFEALDAGNVTEYVEHRLFAGKIDTLSAHIQRKKALAEPTRYSILYLLYEYGEISTRRLTAETGRQGNDLHHHLGILLDAKLIAKIPAPDNADGRQTYYRITTLGKQEIADDVTNILGRGNEHAHRHEMLVDPALSDTETDESDRLRPV